jgi:hypothetical protein
MSSAVFSTSAATGRPFVFEEEAEPEVRSLASASRASLDRTAPSTPLSAGEGGCPHISQQMPEKRGVQESAIARVLQSTIKNQQSKIPPASVTPASRLAIRPAPEMVSSGVPAIDALTGGLPRGCLSEICGPASSGRTTLLLAALAAATRRGEFCAVVDASDALDPRSASAAGVELDRLLWVRCGASSTQEKNSPQRHRGEEKGFFENPEDRIQSRSTNQSEQRLEKVLRATDLLLESGGFGLIALDLGDLPSQAARRIPLTTWFRFRRAVEHTPTILLALEQQAIAGSCSSLLLQLGKPGDELKASIAQDNRLFDADNAGESAAKACPEPVEGRQKNAAHGPSTALRVNSSRGLDAEEGEAPEGRKKVCRGERSAHPAHAQLLTGLNITAELIRSRVERKPARSVTFESKTAWAG